MRTVHVSHFIYLFISLLNLYPDSEFIIINITNQNLHSVYRSLEIHNCAQTSSPPPPRCLPSAPLPPLLPSFPSPFHPSSSPPLSLPSPPPLPSSPRPVSGVNFRSVGIVRRQVVGSLPRRQPGTGTRQQRVGAVTPSLRPEVPDTRFTSPGRGLGIRQTMGWTKVCETARSGIWVLKGNARARMLPANAWVTPGHDCLCPYQYGRGAAVRPQTNDPICDGVIGLWGRVAPLFGVQGRMCQHE